MPGPALVLAGLLVLAAPGGEDLSRAADRTIRRAALLGLPLCAAAALAARRLSRSFPVPDPVRVPWDLYGLAFVLLFYELVRGILSLVMPHEGPGRGRTLILAKTGGDLLTIGVLVILLRSRVGSALRWLGLRNGHWPRALLFGALAYLAYYPLGVGVGELNRLVFPGGVQRSIQLMAEDRGPLALPYYLALGGLVVPFTEEVLFRGFAYAGIRNLVGVTGAVVLSGALFAVGHGMVALFLPIFGLGMLLAWLYHRTGSLAAPVAAHALHNGLTILLLFAHR